MHEVDRLSHLFDEAETMRAFGGNGARFAQVGSPSGGLPMSRRNPSPKPKK